MIINILQYTHSCIDLAFLHRACSRYGCFGVGVHAPMRKVGWSERKWAKPRPRWNTGRSAEGGDDFEPEANKNYDSSASVEMKGIELPFRRSYRRFSYFLPLDISSRPFRPFISFLSKSRSRYRVDTVSRVSIKINIRF